MYEDIFTDEELEKLMEARLLLQSYHGRAWEIAHRHAAGNVTDAFYAGRVAEISGHAGDSIFQVVNVLNSYLNRDVPDHLMFPNAYRTWKDGEDDVADL